MATSRMAPGAAAPRRESSRDTSGQLKRPPFSWAALALIPMVLTGGVFVLFSMIPLIVSLTPLLLVVGAASSLVAIPTLALAIALIVYLESVREGRSSDAPLRWAYRQAKHWLEFGLSFVPAWLFLTVPIQALMALGVVACFSVPWSLAIGAAVFLQAEYSRPGAGDIRRWPDFLEFLDHHSRHWVGYFPMTVHSTAELPPDGRYLFGFHPHGVYCFGLFAVILRRSSGWGALFPGQRSCLVGVANVMFGVPWFGMILSWMGMIPADQKSCDLAVNAHHNLAIIPGGIAEMTLYHGDDGASTPPGSSISTLFLSKRQGFIRLAMKHGYTIVPVYSFGEDRVFRRYSWARDWRIYLSRRFRIALELFRGRWFTLMPFRVPLRVVVGPPIAVRHTAEPTEAEVNEALAKYIAAVRELFEQHKTQYIDGDFTYANTMLEVV